MKKVTASALYLLVSLPFAAQADLLVKGDSLTLTYKNYYWNESAKEGNDGRLWGADRDEWVQTAILDYDTGYLGDWLRLEYGVAAANDLHIGSSVNDVSNLPGASADNGYDPDGMLGTQTAYLSTRYQNEDMTLTAGVGKRSRRSPLYLDSTTRILDATSVGYDLNAKFGGLDLYYTELNKMSLRNEDDWGRKLSNYRGDRIDHLRYFGGGYQFGNGLSLALGQSESKNYLRERKLQASYRHSLDQEHAVLLKATHGTLDDVGVLYDRDAEILPFFAEEIDSAYHEVRAGYELPGHSITLSYANVTGGDWNYNMTAQEVGFWDTSSQWAWSWFGLEGEDSLSLMLSTDFAHYGVPGLQWNIGAWHSDDADGFRNFERFDVTSMLGYRFSGPLEGLSLSWLHSYHRAEGELVDGQRSAFPLGPAGLERKDVDRLYLTYQMTF